MQAYLKLKEKDEDLYEGNLLFNEKEKTGLKLFILHIVNFLIHMYCNFVVCIKKWFNIITVKEIYYGLIFILPISKGHKHKLKKCIKKVKKLMEKYKISTLILSDELENNSILIESFKKNKILEKKLHILDEKGMMPYLIKEIIEYILQKQGKSIELEDLYLLIKQDNSLYRENIVFLTQYFKTINIVTPCIKSYQKFVNKLSEKYDVIITVTNNKKKSLRKAKWIVNFDIPIEEMKKYTVYQKATIIYLQKDGVYQGNAFDGLHICSAGIDVSHEIKEMFEKLHLMEQYPLTILYESTLANKKSLWAIKEQMQQDRVKIEKLYGSRGLLEEDEYKKLNHINT